MAKRLFCLFLALVAAGVFAADLQLTVIDKELGTPLEGVVIRSAGNLSVATDAQGLALIKVPEGSSRLLLTASLPGYETAKVYVKPGEQKLQIALLLAGVLQGKELVVEKSKPQKTDAQAGVSQVADKEQIKSTAQIGLVEDLMSTVKVMPGVGYSGSWNAMPSIRGGDPSETTAVLDGLYVLYPYHWGGAYSIFNPNMVDSAKLSNGIVSARYGRVMSGLLEVNSKTPDLNDPNPKLDASVSTTGADLFLQSALGTQSGLLVGGKITWMEASFALAGQANQFSQVPYIRDGYAKYFWKPDERTEWSWNGFIGTDGVGAKDDSTNKTLTTNGRFTWSNLTALSSLGLKTLLDQDSFFHASLGYNLIRTDLDYKSVTNGTKNYDNDFRTRYGLAASSFTLDNLTTQGTETTFSHLFLAKGEYEKKLSQGTLVSFGAEESLQLWQSHSDNSGWYDDYSTGAPQYLPYHSQTDVSGNKSLQSAVFSIYNFEWFSGKLTGEAGLRGEHTYMFNSDYSLNTLPSVSPRLRLEYSLLKNQGFLDSLSLTGGSGLYSKFPLEGNLFDKKYGLKDFEIGPDRAIFNVLGIEALALDGWKFSLEGYYKYYFNRMYIVADQTSSPTTYNIHDDGTGFAYGFDVLLQKKSSRYWDGWLTYSYIVAKFKNPAKPANSQQTTEQGDPLGSWYYPAYHRFHNLNLIVDWKPLGEGFTVTMKASLASGAPKARLGAVTSYKSTMPNASVIERFYQTSSYDDDLRSDISCPVDLKLTWFGYYSASKIRWEFYFGVENIFANFYSPQTNKSLDPWYGDSLSGSGSADYNFGFPVPSFGFKISY